MRVQPRPHATHNDVGVSTGRGYWDQATTCQPDSVSPGLRGGYAWPRRTAGRDRCLHAGDHWPWGPKAVAAIVVSVQRARVWGTWAYSTGARAFDAAFFVAGRRVMKHTAALLALAAASVLGIAACGGGGGSAAAPAASHTTSPAASPSPLHTAQPGEPALIAVPGYAYTDPASADVTSAKGILKSDPQVLKSVSAHNVLRGGAEIGGIILVRVNRRYANLPEVQQAMMPEMAKAMTGSGAKATPETIHTEKVLITQIKAATTCTSGTTPTQ